MSSRLYESFLAINPFPHLTFCLSSVDIHRARGLPVKLDQTASIIALSPARNLLEP